MVHQRLDALRRQKGVQLGLERMREFVSQAVDFDALPTQWIHVAGTNGKGSTVAFISTALQKLGYSVGTYISPHIFDYRERFQLNGVWMDADTFKTLRQEVLALKGGRDLTEFEILTAMAFIWFSRTKPQFVVLETGLGGRLDATTIGPAVATAITAIGLDHQEFLGDTLEKVAFEKAGIIRDGVPLFSPITQTPEAKPVFETVTQARKSPLIWTASRAVPASFLLQGTWQKENFGLAFDVVRYVHKQQGGAMDDVADHLFETATQPGRFQRIQKGPQTVIVDGAHNEHAMSKILKEVRTQFPNKSLSIIFGVLAKKEVDGIIQCLQTCDAQFFYYPFCDEAHSYDAILKKWPIQTPNHLRQFDPNSWPQTEVVVVVGSLWMISLFLDDAQILNQIQPDSSKLQ